MADNALKRPLTNTVQSFSDKRANDFAQNVAKSMPCHVTAIDKDIVTVAFEPQNGIWTLPTMKMSQAFSLFAREPTQVGDRGYAVPGDFSLSGVTDIGGGNVSFYPKGNLTPLVFHPTSRTDFESRDYDQYTVTGGPNGVKIIQTTQKKQQSQTGNKSAITRSLMRLSSSERQRWLHSRTKAVKPLASQQQTQMAYMQIDKNGLITHQSEDGKHQVVIDEKGKKAFINVPAQGSDNVWLGGTGKNSQLYGPVMVMGPSGPVPAVNCQAKYVQQDDN